MAKPAAIAYAFLFLVVAGTTMPKASSFEIFPSIIECGKALVEIEHCIVKLVPSFLSLHIRLNQECCKAILDIEENCLPVLFTAPVIGPTLTNFTSSVCGVLSDPSPPPPSMALH